MKWLRCILLFGERCARAERPLFLLPLMLSLAPRVAFCLFCGRQAGEGGAPWMLPSSPYQQHAASCDASLCACSPFPLHAERDKESTMGVEMVSQSSRKAAGGSGATLYDFEYELDTTRGRKRVLSTGAPMRCTFAALSWATLCTLRPGMPPAAERTCRGAGFGWPGRRVAVRCHLPDPACSCPAPAHPTPPMQ
jgi:hypothetical protein